MTGPNDPAEPLLAGILRDHCAAPSSNAYEAILAAVDELESRREPLTEHLINRVEFVMVKALNAGVPWERADEFREMIRDMDHDR
jgi:hypothetical protein